ncbi:MAG: hypothetical protein ACFCUX_08335 [Candidatus Methylacidiphilales bacterium]
MSRRRVWWLFSYSRLNVWRLVVLGLSVAWFCKFVPLVYVYNGHLLFPVEVPVLFPHGLSRPELALVCYVLPVLSWIAVVRPYPLWRAAASVLWVLSSLLMLWNVHSYNDATFVVTFWVSLWLCWWQGRVDIPWALNPRDARRALTLGIGIVGMFFLGGAVGKFTEGYYSGRVLHDLYFMQKDLPLYSWSRDNLSSEEVRQLAKWFSIFTLFMESLLATVLLWPRRWALWISTVAMLCMIAGSTVYLTSVLGSAIILCLAMLWIQRSEAVT